MSIVLYDRAVLEKIKGWTEHMNATVLDPDEASRVFSIRADKTGDTPLSLPLITISRQKDVPIRRQNVSPMSMEGWVADISDKIAAHFNAVEIALNYRLDIYTRKFRECDELAREFMFYIQRFPRLTLTIPVNERDRPKDEPPIVYESFMRLGSTLTDNSDIPERAFSGEFKRMTLDFAIDPAFYFSYDLRKICKVVELGIDVDTVNGNRHEPAEQIIKINLDELK